MELEARISAASSSGASFFTWFPIEASAKDARKFSSRGDVWVRGSASACTCLNCLYRQHFSCFWFLAKYFMSTGPHNLMSKRIFCFIGNVSLLF